MPTSTGSYPDSLSSPHRRVDLAQAAPMLMTVLGPALLGHRGETSEHIRWYPVAALLPELEQPPPRTHPSAAGSGKPAGNETLSQIRRACLALAAQAEEEVSTPSRHRPALSMVVPAPGASQQDERRWAEDLVQAKLVLLRLRLQQPPLTAHPSHLAPEERWAKRAAPNQPGGRPATFRERLRSVQTTREALFRNMTQSHSRKHVAGALLKRSMWVDDVGVSERFPKGPWRKTTGGHLLGSLGLRVLWDALKVPKSRGYIKMKVGRNVGVRRFDASDRRPPQITLREARLSILENVCLALWLPSR